MERQDREDGEVVSTPPSAQEERTIGIKLQHLQIHVRIRNHQMQLLIKRQKLHRHGLEIMLRPCKEGHFVRFFLFRLLVL